VTGATLIWRETMSISMDIHELYRFLLDRYDVGNWWPSDSPFEVMVGAILTQQTSWESVTVSLSMMRERGLLSPDVMSRTDPGEIEEMVRPCGFYRQKSQRVIAIARYLEEEWGGDPDRMLEGDLYEARERLLSLQGVGKETADSILLFAGRRPKFVAAAYVSRVLSRTGVLVSSDYDEIQRFVEREFSTDPDELASLYALIVQLAKTHCRSRSECGSCPLRRECETGRIKA
jgi:endonuclease-3 related protein